MLERYVARQCNDHIDALNAVIDNREAIRAKLESEVQMLRDKVHELGEKLFQIYTQLQDGTITETVCRKDMLAACEEYNGLSKELGKARYNLAMFRTMMSDLLIKLDGGSLPRMAAFDPDPGKKIIEELTLQADGKVELSFLFRDMIDRMTEYGIC